MGRLRLSVLLLGVYLALASATPAAARKRPSKVYEAFVKVLPEGRTPYLDDLVKKRDQGTLREHLRQVIPKACS